MDYDHNVKGMCFDSLYFSPEYLQHITLFEDDIDESEAVVE